MKSTSVICWLCERALIHWADTPTRLPVWINHHIAHCASCARMHQQMRGMLEQLVGDAQMQRRTAPDFLVTRIAANLQTRSPRSSHPVFRPSLAVASATCLVLLAGILIAIQSPSPSRDRAQSQASPDVLASSPNFLLAPINQASGQNLLEWSEKLGQPLEREMSLVMNDARNAAQALADSFIPEPIRKAWASSPGKSSSPTR
jgi:hypothetical protein